MDPLIRRVLEGRHTIVTGNGGIVELATEPRVGRIELDCRKLRRPLEPLIEVEHRVQDLLGPSLPPLPSQPEPVPTLDGMGAWIERGVVRHFVNDLGRLASTSDVPPVIVMQATHKADLSTLSALARLVVKRASPVPIVFGIADEDADVVADLVRAVRETEGADAIVAAAPGTQTAGESLPPSEKEVDLHALPPDVRAVLRAGAALGNPFEARGIAYLTALGELTVLETLQRAADAGVPLRDLGEGHFGLPDSVLERILASTLPSLLRAWHARAARMLSDSTDAPKASETASAPDAEPRPNAARAATHAEHAGEVDLAARQLVNAARRAVDLGGYEEALALVERGHRALDRVPEGPARRQLRIALDVQLGRVHWLAAGQSEDYSLPEALQALEGCEERLSPGDPVTLSAEVRRTIAGIRYDMGDPESLEIALDAVARAAKELLDAGQPLRAAELLNDEAAIWLRIGDPVRAHHLLERSREAFRGMVPESQEARQALAHTDHLLAKLIARTPPQPGKDREATARGIEYATGARDTLVELGLRADAARVEETLGRLQRRAGRMDVALEHLLVAARSQKQLGDAIGLARSAEALAELLAELGDTDQAFEMIQSSIALNLRKGSPQGAAFNRAGLALLVEHMDERGRRAFAPIMRRLDAALREVEGSHPPDVLR